MPRGKWISGIALATAITVTAGCATDLLKLDWRAKRAPEQGEVWGPTGRGIRGGQPGLIGIAYGPMTGGAYRDRIFATSHLALHPTDVRVSYARFPQPQVKLWDDWGVELFAVEVA